MWYKTELMEQILTSESAKRMIDYVSPIYGKSRIGLWLFQIIGLELDDVKEICDDIYDQIFVSRATWSLPYWEKAYEITPLPDQTIEQRRQQIQQRRVKKALNPARFEKILSSLSGVEAKIVENTGKNTFQVIFYGTVNNYDEVLRIAKECKPKMIIAGASAYARVIDFKKFREICDEVGAYLMVDMAHIAGLVAGGAHPSPIPYADVVTTTTHKTLRGPRGGMILSSAEAAEKFKFNKSVFPGIQGGPLMHVIAGKAVCLKEALDPSFKTYAENVVKNAQALCNGLMNRGFDIVSGGTDNHLMLVNLISKGVTGKEVEKLLDAANITCNKNTIPNDPASPFVTSGIRLGTAAVTTRGFNEADMDIVADAIAMLVEDVDANKAKAMELVKGLTDKYPLYE